jgi:histidine phosphotransfer protein HptB
MDTLLEIDLNTFDTLKRDMGADFMLEVLHTFCEDASHQMQIMQSALDQGDVPTFTRAAHSLKSTSMTLGALSFSGLVSEMELLGRQGKLEDSREKYLQLQGAVEPLQQALMDLYHASEP